MNVRFHGKTPALILLLFLCHCSLDPLTVEPPLLICDQTKGAGPESPNASRFGLFDTRFYAGYNTGLDTLTRMLGTRPGYILWYLHIDDPFPAAIVTGNIAKGIKTVFSMNITSRNPAINASRNDTLLREITDGIWDSSLTAFAKQAALAAAPVYLRFGYEMNGSWFSWGKKEGDFVAAWNHAHRIFKLAGAVNVEWVFSPGVLYGTMSFKRDIAPYYPGDSVVDIVGLDGYNFGNSTDRWNYRHCWQSFRTVFERSLLAIRSFDKPVWISEVGCPSNPSRPEWLGELFAFMDNNPCVEAMFWFNCHKPDEPDFRIESDSASLAVIRSWLGK